MDEGIKEILMCECGGHAVVFQRWADGSGSLAIFQFASWGKTDWRTRLEHIWHIIRHGRPWQDDVMLSADDMRRLAEMLSDG